MLFKQVKEYSKRQRIDINKSDGLTPGDEVAIIPVKKYEELEAELLELQENIKQKDNEIQLLQKQDQNLKEIIQDVTAPIYENHKKELQKKDSEIKQLQVQLELMKRKTNQYNLELMGLNAIDIAIFRKHKKIIKNYSEEIAVVGVDPKIIDADAKAIPGNELHD